MNAPRNAREPAAGPDSPQQTTSRRLTVLYVFALSTVAVLSIGAQWLIRQQLSTGESDSRVINVAGRQRMLSQRLAKASLSILSEDEPTAADALAELADTLETWSDNHRALQEGDALFGLPGNNSEEVRDLFASIEQEFEAMRNAAASLLREPDARDIQDVAIIQSHEGAFLLGMDRIVSQLVAEAEQRVARLGALEWTILVLTLGVLLAEGLFIFRPAVRHIRQTVARLSDLSENLRRSRDEAEEANAAKSRFLANVSHELRTPMTAVLGMTELAQRSESNEDRQRYLRIVEEAGENLLGLLNDLIDLSQIDAHALELRAEPFSPGESVRRVARMMEPACLAKGIRLTTDLPDSEASALGDARRLEQVLVNLVANAIKWTDAGEVGVACRTSPGENGVRLRFAVRDTGVGIHESDQQRVFEPFAQSDGEGASRGGVGLGLAICRQLSEAMGGRLELQSAAGVGTTVTLDLALPIADAIRPEAATEPSGQIEATPLSVLIVEDAEVNQLLLRKLLEEEGNRAEVVSTGEAALRRCGEKTFDVALIDYQLPGINGVETAKRLRDLKSPSAPRLLCVSAHAGLPEEIQPPGLFDAYLTKPIRGAELLAALRPTGQAPRPEEDREGDQSYQRELTETFLNHFEEQHGQLANAVKQRNWSHVALLAHRFKGQVGYFRADSLALQLGKLERCCQEGSASTLPRHAEEVLTGLSALQERLRSAT